MYFEDADLCRRARAAGWLVYYLPHVEIVHQTGASSRSKPKAIWLLHKSAFLYHRKHGVHGPFGAYSAMVLAGLTLRALAKLGSRCSRDRSSGSQPVVFGPGISLVSAVPIVRQGPSGILVQRWGGAVFVARGSGFWMGHCIPIAGSFHRMDPSYSGAK